MTICSRVYGSSWDFSPDFLESIGFWQVGKLPYSPFFPCSVPTGEFCDGSWTSGAVTCEV